jgi:hypothetical protein
MAGLSLLLAGALAGAPTSGPNFDRLMLFATIERSPSFERTTRLRIGMVPDLRGGRDGVYWFMKDVRTSRDKFSPALVVSSQSCPSAMPIMRQLERLPLGTPDVPGLGQDALPWPKDGTSYSLKGISRQLGAQRGEYSAFTNSGSALAKWTDHLFSALERCWPKRST